MAGMVEGSLLAQTALRAQGVFLPPGLFTGDIHDSTVKQNEASQVSLNFGTYTGQVDTTVFQARAIPASSSATYDLYTGTDLTDLNGNTAAFRVIRYAGAVVLSGGTTAGVRLGGAAANEWTGFFAAAGYKFDIFPSGPPWQGGSPAGKTVSSTVKNFKVENLGTAEVVVLLVFGGSIQESGGFRGSFLPVYTYP